MAKINIANLNKRRKLDLSDIGKLIRFVLKKIAFRKKCCVINVVFVSNQEIKKLNKKFKNKNMTTDVLCFCMPEVLKTGCDGSRAQTIVDVYISTDEALANSKKYKTDFFYEVKFYVVHGLLHMNGFDDDTIKKRDKMLFYQEELIKEYEK